MNLIGTFPSARWGTVQVHAATYEGPDGPLAVVLTDTDGQLITKLSVNMYRPSCSADSQDLPKDCFYMKDWSENQEIAAEALKSNLFKHRPDLPISVSGHVWAEVFQIVPQP